MNAMKVEKVGRRFYAMGAPFAMKETLKDLGCTWDGDRRAWWTGKSEVAERLEALATKQAAAPAGAPEALNLDAKIVNGRAEYKGKTYYILIYADKRDGSGKCAKLASRDGTMTFWASDMGAFRVIKLYREPTSINSLRAFAEKAKTFGTDRCDCGCHNERNAGRPGTTIYDGCDRCGCEAC